MSKKYPPLFVVDLHEDNIVDANYVYSTGRLGLEDPLAIAIEEIVRGNANSFNGITRFADEKIANGIISIRDGSATTMMGENKIYQRGVLVPGPNACAVITVETNSKLELNQRIQTHEKVIAKLPELRELVLTNQAYNVSIRD